MNQWGRHTISHYRPFTLGVVIAWFLVVIAFAPSAESLQVQDPVTSDHVLDSLRDTTIVEIDSTAVDSGLIGSGPWPYRPVLNWAFGVAETLYYDIGWQSIVAAHGKMYVNDPIDTNGRLCYPIYSTVKSTSFFSTFFRVEDSALTMMDVHELYPVRFEKYLREGKYRADRIADFDPERGLCYTPSDTLIVPPYVQDALSLLFYVRTLDLQPGQDLQVENYDGKNVYTLTVRVLRRERVKVKAGTFSAIVVEPLLQAAGLFKHEGRLTVWLSDDRLHLPILMKSKVLVGSIVAELTGYSLGRIQRFRQ
jgi:hypothetical protein